MGITPAAWLCLLCPFLFAASSSERTVFRLFAMWIPLALFISVYQIRISDADWQQVHDKAEQAKLCIQYGLSVVKPKQKQKQEHTMSDREYRAYDKGHIRLLT